MSKWTGYYKIVQPKSETSRLTDNQNLGDQGSYGNYTWYQRLVQGSGSRLTKYREYDMMDNDVEVARALDTIAEEMTGNNPKTDEPLELDFHEEDIDTKTVMTVKVALEHWSRVHNWENRLFKIARNLVKFGDCFFKKDDKFKRWVYVNPKNVIGAIVAKEDASKIIGWQIRKNIKKVKAAYGVQMSGSNEQDQTEVVDADHMVRFTLNDDMSEATPFGESVLRAVYRAHKQKELLEDAILIYRIQRAPERRVFYIDVGKMPAQRVKRYLNQIKNEIKQKKIPTMAGGKNEIESVYNPQSMSEDFFFAQRADGKGSRVETLPGGQGLGELADLEYFQAKVFRGLRVPVSYMKSGSEGGIFNDGKVGVAYIEELRFSLFIERLQGYIESVMDREFKLFMRESNVHIDEDIYRLRLPEPSNFGTYRQQEMDSQLLSSYGTADSLPYLSKRFNLKRFMQWSDEDIAENERMILEERGLDENDKQALAMIYNPEGAAGMGAEGGEAGGGDLGGGEMTAGADAGGGDAGGGDIEL